MADVEKQPDDRKIVEIATKIGRGQATPEEVKEMSTRIYKQAREISNLIIERAGRD